MKPKTCNKKGCNEPKWKNPGNSTINFKYCLKHQLEANLSKVRADAAKDKEGLENARKTPKKTATERFYSSSAWRNCSHYILLHYADDDLMVQCCTNPNLIYKVTDKNIQTGHYLKSNEHKSTAFEFKNLAPQSYSENRHKSGNQEEMAKWIEKTHGAGTVEWLNIKKNEVCKLDKYELNLISKHYLKLLNEELKRREIQNPWKQQK